MTHQTPGPVPTEHLENALIVASLAHATARTPAERDVAWRRLMDLKRQRDQARGRTGNAHG